MQFTALILGLAGSLHCMGMCSPLALAITNMSKGALLTRILYNTGRILTYSLMGAFVGFAGYMLPLTGFQNLISITLGILLLTAGLGGLGNFKIPFVITGLQKSTSFLKKLFADFLKQKGKTAVVMLGSINGLLPCGLTFIALTFCLTLKGPMDGFNFMLLFGMGTLPAMLGLASVINPMAKWLRFNTKHVTTALLILSGCLLIARVFLNHPLDPSQEHMLVDIVLCR